MTKIRTIERLWRTDKRGVGIAFFNYIIKSGVLNWMSDKVFLNLTFFVHFGRFINWGKPITFNEKLQWLKIYDRNPEYVKMVDKCDVKKYVAEIIGEEFVIPTIGVWEKVDEIPFESLPNQYVLKCTHDSGSVCVCKDSSEFDIIYAKKKLVKGLRRNLFYWGREWPYKNVKPRIVAETYMKGENDDLMDYKLMCFNGKVKCSFVCSERFTSDDLKVTFFDRDWNLMPFTRQHPFSERPIQQPASYLKMVEMAEKLSHGIPFVRIDFYEIYGHPFFGEMTFFPGNGFEKFEPEEWDYKLGEWLNIQ